MRSVIFTTYARDISNFNLIASVLGKNLFGRGNLGSTFKAFKSDHQCNKFCTWFGLDPLEQSGSENLFTGVLSALSEREDGEAGNVHGNKGKGVDRGESGDLESEEESGDFESEEESE